MLHSDVLYVYGNHNLKDYRKAVLKEHRFGAGVEDSYNTKFYGFMIDGRCYRDPRSGLLTAGLGEACSTTEATASTPRGR